MKGEKKERDKSSPTDLKFGLSSMNIYTADLLYDARKAEIHNNSNHKKITINKKSN